MQPLNNTLGIPAFLSKLWKMVDDPKTDNLICWSKDGKTFIIKNEVEFWYTLLPAYYKHNNMSSFVRQLNMYGFHKVSNLDNGSIENDKVEYQFLHPYFKRGQPQLLKNIKRKVTNSKVIPAEKAVQNYENDDQINTVLADVKYLHSRQSQVDSALKNLKHENSVLWRELAVLRQKHQKQQQIVNKLILQFLVSIVQPQRMSNLGVKRRYPLMINEKPTKKQKNKSSNSDGPTIHELDSADVLPEKFVEVFVGENEAGDEQVESPPSTSSLNQKSPAMLLDEVEEINIKPEIFLESSNLQPAIDKLNAVTVDELLTDTGISDEAASIDIVNNDFDNDEAVLIDGDDSDRVFLNPTSQDTLLSNLINGSYNTNVLNNTKATAANTAATTTSSSTSTEKKDSTTANPKNSLTVATCDPPFGISRLNSVTQEESFCSREEMNNYVENTQNELDQLKDFLNVCNGIDSSYLLNLFNDMPSYGLTPNQSREEVPEIHTELLSGSELAPYDSGIVDFSELLDDSADATPNYNLVDYLEEGVDEASINTPDVSTLKPTFPLGKK